METLVRRNRPHAIRLLHKTFTATLEVMPVPVAGEVAIADHDRMGGIEQMLGLSYRVYWAERMRRDSDDAAGRAERTQDPFHAVFGSVKLVFDSLCGYAEAQI